MASSSSSSSIEERQSRLVKQDSEEQAHEQKLKEIEHFSSSGFLGLLEFSVNNITRKASSDDGLKVGGVTFSVSPVGVSSQSSDNSSNKVTVGESVSVALKQTKGSNVTFNIKIVDASDFFNRDVMCDFAVADIPAEYSYHCILEADGWSLNLSTDFKDFTYLRKHHSTSIEQIREEKRSSSSRNNNNNNSNSSGGGDDEAEEWESDVDEEVEEEVVTKPSKPRKSEKNKGEGKKGGSTSVSKSTKSVFDRLWNSSIINALKPKNLGRTFGMLIGGTLQHRAFVFFGFAAIGVFKYGDYASV